MSRSRFRSALLASLMALAGAISSPNTALAEGNEPPAQTEQTARALMSLEVNLYLLVASDAAASGATAPPGLEPVLKRIQSTLQYSSFRVAASFLHRVANRGTVEASGLTPPLLSVRTTPEQPSFYSLHLQTVETRKGDGGRDMIQVDRLQFGMRVPVTVGQGAAGTVYENVGIVNTNGLSIPEGEPTIVGTTSTGRPGEVFVLVALVRRAGA